MDQPQTPETRKKAYHLPALSWAEWLVLAIAAALLAVLAFNLGTELHRQGEARAALANAKASRLAACVISAEQLAEKQPFADFTTATGMAPGVAARIRELSQCPGTVRLAQTDETGYKIRAFVYTEGAYTVAYTEENSSWAVTRGETRLAYSAESG